MALTKIIGDGIGSLNTPAFFAKMSANQDISDSTDTKVAFDTEIYDTDSKYDHSTNYRFTPAVAGTYFLYTQVHGISNNNSEVADIIMSIRKNNASIYSTRGNFQSNRPNQIAFDLQITDIANTTDYYEVFFYMDDQSGDPDISASIGGAWGGSVISFFGGYKLIGV